MVTSKNLLSFYPSRNGKIDLPNNILRVNIDVGLSYTATFSERWLRETDNLAVFGFEPVIDSYTNITQAYSEILSKTLFPICCALSDEEGTTILYVAKDYPECSSLHVPKTIPLSHQQPVSTIRLESFFDIFPWDRIPVIDKIKMDTQGHELKVLKGAGDYLVNVVEIIAEVGPLESSQYEDTRTEEEVDEYLKKYNFRAMGVIDSDYNKLYRNERFI